MSNSGRISLNEQINDEAARWFVELRSGDIDARGRLAFDAWVRASPEHLRAFIEIAGLWRYAADLDLRGRFSIEALVADVADEGNVLSMPTRSGPAATSAPPPARTIPRLRRYMSFRVTAAAGVLLLVTASLVAWSLMAGRQVYATQVGEERTLRLADGSMLTLNSRSRVRVEFTKSTRTVDLLDGEALFHVAKNATRPFIVRAEGAFVRVIGTEFDVDKRSSGTVVTVVEGRVAVVANSVDAGHPRGQESTPDESPQAVILSAGEQIKVAIGALAQPVRTDITSAVAWTRGRVILDSATLVEIADEFNRYSERKLTTEDHGERPLRLSGVFSTDPRFLIDYLRERPDIRVTVTETEIRIVRE
ncbi:MAG: anti-FecI sigma factor, FecR [Gammaproteobacteria bacterium]|nr:anti-FecI sigma factor, FecR [Gammaproteobacteria bacterium]